MMNEVTRLDVEIAIAKTGTVIYSLQDIRECNAIWKDPPMIEKVERIWKQLEELQEFLDNSI